MAMHWQDDPKGVKGLKVAHSTTCPRNTNIDARRCTCPNGPSYRKRMWDPAKSGGKGGATWSATTHDRAEALGASSARKKALAERARVARQSKTFGDVAREWWSGVWAGDIEKRRGGATEWSSTTLAGYRNILFNLLLHPEWGNFDHRPGDLIEPVEWQKFFNRLRKAGPSGKPVGRSRLDEILAVIRSIYHYATLPTRAYWPVDPTTTVQLPPRKKPRRRTVVTITQAKALLEALPVDQRPAYALSIGAGLRRGELARVDWSELDLEAAELLVPAAKSEAGTMRRPAVMKLGVRALAAEWERQGHPRRGLVVQRSVYSGKHAKAAKKAWETLNEARVGRGEEGIPTITLHEGRHTYASTLMASGHTKTELMSWMGHSTLAATEKYLQELPQRADISKAERLHAYEDGFDPPAPRGATDVAALVRQLEEHGYRVERRDAA